MNARRVSWLALALALLSFAPSAQAQRRTTVGFDKACNRAATPGVFTAGYKPVSGGLFAACGLSSVASGGLTGQMQLAQSGLLVAIPGVTGEVALAGSSNFNLNTAGEVTIVFAPPVNELSFDALSIDNASGLKVTLSAPLGAALPPVDNPTATAGTIKYMRSSATPIERMVIAYQPAVLGLGDGWFIDQLSFNAWVCGDGELEQGETCDDGNRVQCDGCNNSCQPSLTGCFNGTTCIAFGASANCSVCSMSTPTGPSGDIPTAPGPVGSPCDDNLFCTLPGSCDSAGQCQAPANSCSDGVDCTSDSCDEVNDQCLHAIGDKSCLIAGTCVNSGTVNPGNVCQQCNPTVTQTAWGPQSPGKQCGDPSCMAGTATAAATCDASGQCLAGATQSCMFALCSNAITCDGRCSGDQQCPQQAYCDFIATGCVPDLPLASACTRDAQCGTNRCVDGVCCDRACNGACESCALDGKLGTCSTLPALSGDPEGMCSAGQFCSASGACTNPVVVVPPPPPGTSIDARPTGTGCDRNEVCGSGVCRDGICCDRACDGLCESCAVAGRPLGQCLPFPLGLDPDNECGGAGAVCDGASACTEFETRGNGLCAALPSRDDGGGRSAALVALLTLAGALVVRRRKQRAERRKRT